MAPQRAALIQTRGLWAAVQEKEQVSGKKKGKKCYISFAVKERVSSAYLEIMLFLLPLYIGQKKQK